MTENQLSLFQASYEPFRIKGKIKLIEAFGGIGSQAKALEVLGADFEHYKLIEWAVPSIKAYNAIHIKDFTNYANGLTKEELIEKVNGISVDYNQPLTKEQLKKKSLEWLSDVYNNMVATHDTCPDISAIKGSDLEIENEDTRKDTFILTYSFPCQDISLAGLGKGYSRDGNTRSGLLWQVERILYELKDLHQRPNVLIMENVQGVLTDLKSWNSWLESLTALGYTNYYKKINAKDYGIPQNRVRVFMISILGDYSYVFPRKTKLKYNLKDFLDKGKVDEKYYLSEKMIQYIQSESPKHTGSLGPAKVNKNIASTITTREGNIRACESNYELENNRERELDLKVLNVGNAGNGHHSKDIISPNGVMATITTGNHNNWQLIAIKNNTKQGYLFAEDGDGIDISTRMEKHRGTVQKKSCQTITCMGGENVGVVVNESICNKTNKKSH